MSQIYDEAKEIVERRGGTMRGIKERKGNLEIDPPKSTPKSKLPTPNFVLATGEPSFGLRFEFCVKKTISNRIKYWLFCKFFPFRIERWDELE